MLNYKILSKSPSVTVDELKSQLHLGDDDSFDGELERFILSADDYVLGQLGKAFGSFRVRVYVDRFSYLVLPWASVSDVEAYYVDASGEQQQLPTVLVQADTTGPKAAIHFTADAEGYTAGLVSNTLTYPRFIDMAVSEPLGASVKQAVLMAAAELFEARTDTSEVQRHKVSLTVNRLLNQHKRVVV